MKHIRLSGGSLVLGAVLLSTGCIAYPDGTVAVLPPPTVIVGPPVVVAPAPLVSRRVYAYRAARYYRPYYYGRRQGWYGVGRYRSWQGR